MKLVKESLNEVISFTRGKDTLSTLGIGQINLIKEWLDKMHVEGYTINDDLTIDVKYGLDFIGIAEFPSFIKFNKVKGYFSCSYNDLTSLEGCPKIVSTTFDCSHNNLTSLKGCPKTVGQDFLCEDNKVEFTEEYVRSLCDVK